MKYFLFVITILLSIPSFSQEICDNGIDDDADGLIDLNDTTDCSCSGPAIVPFTIPNPSFEDRSCCPTNSGQMNCVNSWSSPSTGTSDYFNTCGTTHIPLFGGSDPAPTPYPDGGAFVGFFNYGASKEYVGTCLTQPMLAGETYHFSFNLHKSAGADSVPMAIYGSPFCGDIPFAGFGCPQAGSGLVELGNVLVDVSSGNWEQGIIDFTPSQNINAIVVGPSCAEVPGTNFYHMDNFIVTKDTLGTSPLNPITISQSGTGCGFPVTLTANHSNSGGGYQWYKNGIAIIGATNTTYVINSGSTSDNYQVRYTVGGDCVNSPKFPVSISNLSFDLIKQNSCSGSNNGSIQVRNITGGIGQNTFQINGNTAITDSNFQNLTPAFYTVTVTDNNGCSLSDTIIVQDSPSPTANFTFDTVCIGNPTTFTNQSTISGSSIATYKWDYGTGDTSNLQSPSYTFDPAGTYSVRLITTSTEGCTDTATNSVLVNNGPNTSFSYTPACKGDTTFFTNQTTFNGNAYDNTYTFTWNFGDGNTASTPDAKNPYLTDGPFTVTLTTEVAGCTTDTSIQITPSPSPSAFFTATNACENNAIAFTDYSLGSITNYLWNFTPTDSSTNQNPTYTFPTAGTKNVTLTVTSTDGCVKDTTLPIVVNPKPIANFTFPGTCIGRSTTFTDSSSITTGNITTYQWNFNNQSSSTIQNPTYTFTTPGNKNVILTITSDQGCRDTIAKNVSVNDGPTANFSSLGACPNFPLSFVNLSNTKGTPYDNTFTFNWNFGNGDTSVLANPTTIFTSSGTYPIQLSASAGDGCTHDTTINVIVFELPIANFLADTVCFREATSLVDVSTVANSSIASTSWLIEGQTQTNSPLTYVFKSDSLHVVQLISTSAQGCRDTISKPVLVYELPIANFNTSSNSIDLAESSIEFTNTSLQANSYTWIFGNYGTSNQTNASFNFVNVQPCEIITNTLIAQNTQGCLDSISKEISSVDNIILYYPNSFTPDGDGINDVYKTSILGIDSKIGSYQFTIFNRWGQVVFETQDTDNFWDGKKDGVPAPPGVYPWRISTKEACGTQKKQYAGHVVLVK